MRQLSREIINSLKLDQPARMAETREFYVAGWDCEIKIRKPTVNDFAFAEEAGWHLVDGEQKSNEGLRRAALICKCVDGFDFDKDFEFLCEGPYLGIVFDLYTEIMDFSGIGKSIENALIAKKKE